MKIIGENLNIMSPRIGEALKYRDPEPLRAIALSQAEAGVDYMDINLGPARKEGPELMKWVVDTVQEVSDIPLCLDTTNIEAMESGLKSAKGRALLNSISARPERMKALLPLARKYDAAFIGLTLGSEGIPRDADERGFLAAQLIAEASAYGLDEEDIWLDPLALPVNTQQDQVLRCNEFVAMLPELAPHGKSTCGLSNISSGVPADRRRLLNRTYLIMLKRYGLYSVIANAFDDELRAIVRGDMPEIESLVFKVMDGEEIDLSALSPEEAGYVKTARVLLGESIYSDSWLEV